MAKRAALTNLAGAGRLVSKGAGLADSAVAEPVRAGRRDRAKTQADGRRGVLVRLNPEAWRTLKIMGAEENLTLQEIMEQAINLRLKQSGKPPIA